MEVIGIMRVRANGALDQRGRRRGGKKWVDSGPVLKVGLAGISVWMWVETRGEIKDVSKVSGLSNGKDGAKLPEPGKTGGEGRFEVDGSSVLDMLRLISSEAPTGGH